jgi:hypothetical protein
MNDKELDLDAIITEDFEVVSIDDLDDMGEIIEREYVDIEVDDYDGYEETEIETEGLQLWDRVGPRGESMMLDRETLMEHFGENEYDTY